MAAAVKAKRLMIAQSVPANFNLIQVKKEKKGMGNPTDRWMKKMNDCKKKTKKSLSKKITRETQKLSS